MTQSPVINVSPTFNVSQAIHGADDANHPAPLTSATPPSDSGDDSKDRGPRLYSLPPRICELNLSSEWGPFTEGRNAGGAVMKAIVATFRMAKLSADRRGTFITARLSYREEEHFGIRADFREFHRVNQGAWVDEEFNSAEMTLTDTKELILVLEDGGKFAAVQDNRHGVSKNAGLLVRALEPRGESFFVDVTLVDEYFGPIITYTYRIDANPLRVHEIIRVPRISL